MYSFCVLEQIRTTNESFMFIEIKFQNVYHSLIFSHLNDLKSRREEN